MTQQELNQQIARHTGESRKEIRRRGFSLMKVSNAASDEPGTDEPNEDLLWLIFATQQQEQG